MNKNNQKRGLVGVAILALVILFALIAETYLMSVAAVNRRWPPPPDFSAYTNVNEKKQVFFNYLRPIVTAENLRIEKLRQRIEALRDKKNPVPEDLQWLRTIAESYRVTLSDPLTANDFAHLLQKVDGLPASLVLAQAAIESAWGTSRFAKDGYNYFGQWCFSDGCGIVPNSRAKDKSHEVSVFDSVYHAVTSYCQNLNSHPAYAKFRLLRQQARTKGLPLNGCNLAQGLEDYSERGKVYINEVRQMIRINDLSPDSNLCGDLKIESAENTAESSHG